MTCLIVDDDPEDHEIFSMAIAEVKPNYICVFKSSALEALTYLDAHTTCPDYIFLDMNMPKMDGMQCLGEIRSRTQFISTPVLMYSTSSDKYFTDKSLKNGASGFITKPSRVDDLVTALREVFEKDKF